MILCPYALKFMKEQEEMQKQQQLHTLTDEDEQSASVKMKKGVCPKSMGISKKKTKGCHVIKKKVKEAKTMAKLRQGAITSIDEDLRTRLAFEILVLGKDKMEVSKQNGLEISMIEEILKAHALENSSKDEPKEATKSVDNTDESDLENSQDLEYLDGDPRHLAKDRCKLQLHISPDQEPSTNSSNTENPQKQRGFFTMELDELIRISPDLCMDLRTKCELECIDPDQLMFKKNVVHIPKTETFKISPNFKVTQSLESGERECLEHMHKIFQEMKKERDNQKIEKTYQQQEKDEISESKQEESHQTIELPLQQIEESLNLKPQAECPFNHQQLQHAQKPITLQSNPTPQSIQTISYQQSPFQPIQNQQLHQLNLQSAPVTTTYRQQISVPQQAILIQHGYAQQATQSQQAPPQQIRFIQHQARLPAQQQPYQLIVAPASSMHQQQPQQVYFQPMQHQQVQQQYQHPTISSQQVNILQHAQLVNNIITPNQPPQAQQQPSGYVLINNNAISQQIPQQFN